MSLWCEQSQFCAHGKAVYREICSLFLDTGLNFGSTTQFHNWLSCSRIAVSEFDSFLFFCFSFFSPFRTRSKNHPYFPLQKLLNPKWEGELEPLAVCVFNVTSYCFPACSGCVHNVPCGGTRQSCSHFISCQWPVHRGEKELQLFTPTAQTF